MAKKPKKAVDELFDEDAEAAPEVAPEVAPSRAEAAPAALPVSLSAQGQIDVLRRVNRNAKGVERDGRKIAILMPNKMQYGLELEPHAGAVLKPSDVARWVRLA